MSSINIYYVAKEKLVDKRRELAYVTGGAPPSGRGDIINDK